MLGYIAKEKGHVARIAEFVIEKVSRGSEWRQNHVRCRQDSKNQGL